MGVVVQFNYAQWVGMYPEFSRVTQPVATGYFNQATIYCRNDGGGPVNDPSVKSTLLNMLTAHIAALNSPQDSQGNSATGGQSQASTLVGRITSASEGSVSVSVDMPSTPNNAWFLQTKYGAAYWQAISGFRQMRYRANPQRVVGSGPWWGR